MSKNPKLIKIKGDLNYIVSSTQCHWNGENYVDIPKDILTGAQAFVEINRDTDEPRTIMYCVYKNNKGFYTKIKGKRIYLKDMENGYVN